MQLQYLHTARSNRPLSPFRTAHLTGGTDVVCVQVVTARLPVVYSASIFWDDCRFTYKHDSQIVTRQEEERANKVRVRLEPLGPDAALMQETGTDWDQFCTSCTENTARPGAIGLSRSQLVVHCVQLRYGRERDRAFSSGAKLYDISWLPNPLDTASHPRRNHGHFSHESVNMCEPHWRMGPAEWGSPSLHVRAARHRFNFN